MILLAPPTLPQAEQKRCASCQTNSPPPTFISDLNPVHYLASHIAMQSSGQYLHIHIHIKVAVWKSTCMRNIPHFTPYSTTRLACIVIVRTSQNKNVRCVVTLSQYRITLFQLLSELSSEVCISVHSMFMTVSNC